MTSSRDWKATVEQPDPLAVRVAFVGTGDTRLALTNEARQELRALLWHRCLKRLRSIAAWAAERDAAEDASETSRPPGGNGEQEQRDAAARAAEGAVTLLDNELAEREAQLLKDVAFQAKRPLAELYLVLWQRAVLRCPGRLAALAAGLAADL